MGKTSTGSIVCSTKEIAFFYARFVALGRVVSIIVTFLFWCSVSTGMFALYKVGMIQLSYIGSLNQVLTLLGIAPMGLAVLTWRVAEKAIFRYLDKYAENHCSGDSS